MNLFFRIKILLLDCLFPSFCRKCGKEGVLLCLDCRKELKFRPPVCFACGKIVPAEGRAPAGRTCRDCRGRTPVYAFLSPFSYQDPFIRTLIHDLKYKRMRAIALLFAALMQDYAAYYAVELPMDAIVSAIPLHKSRTRFRGFNQAAFIARYFAGFHGRSFIENTLFKIKKTKPQVGLLAENRRGNVRGSFLVAGSGEIAGKTIVLFDDVKTTGATLEEAAYILKQAGAEKIWAVTIAH